MLRSLRMRTYIVVLLMIFLSSCRSVERTLVCNAVEDYSVGVIEACTYSHQFKGCYCYDFDFESWSAVSDVRREDESYCDDLQGFKLDYSLQHIQPKIKALSR